MRFLFISAIALLLLASMTSCGGESSEATAGASAKGTAQNNNQTTSGPQSIHPTTAGGSAKAVPSGIDFQASDIDGTVHLSSEWIGQQPVVINVWGTWCPPCRREIPDLVRLYNEYRGKGVEMLGLAVRDTPEKVRAFTQQNRMKWVMMTAGPSTLVTLGNISGVPTTIFLDSEGNEVQRFVGPRSYEEFKQAFEAIL